MMLKNAAWLVDQLHGSFPQLDRQEILARNDASARRRRTDGEPTEYAYAVVMPHVSRDVLTEFLTDRDNRLS